MKRRSKYNAVRTILDGHKFHSRKEAQDWSYLKIRERAGEIKDLRRQVKFDLFGAKVDVNQCAILAAKACAYIADFVYFDVKENREIIADSKGVETEAFRLKKKLMLICYGIQVECI